MKFLNKLERKFGKYAIHNLMMYIIFGNAVVFLLGQLAPELYDKLLFYPPLIVRGEIWRLFTFVLIPPTTSIIFVIFVLLFYYSIGSALEREWGAFKFNMYYLLGCIFTIVIGFVFNQVVTSVYLFLSLFLAFATLYPNYTIRIYFVLPVKIKWLAYINWAYFLVTILFFPVPSKLMAIAGLLNYFIFFWTDIIRLIKRLTSGQVRKQTYKRQARPKGGQRGQVIKASFHKCSVCGKTELDDPDMEFRYCSKCSDAKEYCMDHLFDHEHH